MQRFRHNSPQPLHDKCLSGTRLGANPETNPENNPQKKRFIIDTAKTQRLAQADMSNRLVTWNVLKRSLCQMTLWIIPTVASWAASASSVGASETFLTAAAFSTVEFTPLPCRAERQCRRLRRPASVEYHVHLTCSTKRRRLASLE